MSSLSDAEEIAVLNHIMGKSALTFPATVALALCTVVPTDASTGATIVEANYTGYARTVIAPSDLNSAAAGQITNANDIVFAPCTGGSSVIVGVAILDSSTIGAGNIIGWASVTSITVDSTHTPLTVPAGQLVFTLD